ncbi:MAG: elongation factor G [Desulfovibrionaceae bacterium]
MSKKPPAKAYLGNIRNIGVIAHIDAGKTTLTERMLYYSGKIHRMGEVHDGAATMDYMPEEQERGITITSALTTCLWDGHTINIIDTPGHVDFTIEVQRSLRVLDGAVGVFCAVGGVEPQSETVWRQSEAYHVPKLAFVNKLDRLGADFEGVLESMRTRLAAKPLALAIPDGLGAEFSTVLDLVRMKKLVYDTESFGQLHEEVEPTPEELEKMAPWRVQLLETLGEEDEEFLELYLSGEEVAEEDIRRAVRRVTLDLKLAPVLCGSALKNIGVQPVMQAVCDYLPSPVDVAQVHGIDPETHAKKFFPLDPAEPLSALAFKVAMDSGRKLVIMRLYSGVLEAGATVYNQTQDKDERVARLFQLHAGRKEKLDRAKAGDIVAAAGMKFARTGDTLCLKDDPIILESISGYKPVISLAIEPRNSEEGDKLDEVLEKYLLEDPTLTVERDEDTGQIILSGMGELHLEVVLERIKREYKLAPRSGAPQVVYQETVAGSAEATQTFHRELGETMHFGQVKLSVEGLPRDSGRDVRFELDREGLPEAWAQAAAEGVQDGLQSGVLKGYPVQDVRVKILEMPRKEVESSAAGYRMAASMALRAALNEASPVLMEPIMWLEIGAPDEFVGDVSGLLAQKGARIDNMFDRAGQKIIQALAPLRKLFGFSTELRSASQGRAGFMMRFHKFDVME